MKVGDIVRQNDRIIKMKGRSPPTRLGTVVAIAPMMPEHTQMSENQKSWMEHLGRRIDVLWDNGTLTEGFSERALDVIIQKG